jgi:DNA invertase Pin-like site-specific DNA recombinase
MDETGKALEGVTMPRRAYSYIRISSKRQEKGAGKGRQNEYAPALCKREGWALDKKVILDVCSAYRGSNADVGNLARFLEMVEEGEIPSGSVLIIESLDRLSRDEVDEAYDLFRKLIRAGIWIATRTPERIYSRETSKNFLDLLEPLFIFLQAHEESQTKSFRSRKNWEGKKRDARESGKPLSSACPAWLRLRGGAYQFRPGAERVLRQICRWALDGLGEQRITERLNADPQRYLPFGWHPPLVPTWSRTTVGQLLADPRLYGAHQPVTFVEVPRSKSRGTRMARRPDGEPIEGYYPAVLSKEEWQRLQLERRSRAGCSGRPGAEEANLFTGRLWRAGTRRTLQLKPTYSGGNVYHYLREAEPALDPGRIDYPSLEDALLDMLADMDAFDLRPGDGRGDPRRRRIDELLKRLPLVNDRVRVIEEQLADVTTEGEGDGAAALSALLARLAGNRADMLRELKQLQEEVAAGGSEDLATAQGLIEVYRDLRPGDPKRPACRLRLKAIIRALVERVWLHAEPIRKGSRVVHVQVNLRAGGRRYLQVLQSKTIDLFEAPDLSGLDFAELAPPPAAAAGKARRKASLPAAG